MSQLSQRSADSGQVADVHPNVARILVVDDNPHNRRILDKLLAGEHYDVRFAEDGPAGLAAVAAFEPHIVLLDVMMPGVDGYHVCRQIKNEAGDAFRQVILLSGRASIAERLRGYEHLADDYLSKPYDHTELLFKIRACLRMRERELRGPAAGAAS